MRVTVFKVIGYEYKTPEGNYLEACVFWIYANNADDALSGVTTYGVNKKHYDILEVIEKDEHVTA